MAYLRNIKVGDVVEYFEYGNLKEKATVVKVTETTFDVVMNGVVRKFMKRTGRRHGDSYTYSQSRIRNFWSEESDKLIAEQNARIDRMADVHKLQKIDWRTFTNEQLASIVKHIESLNE